MLLRPAPSHVSEAKLRKPPEQKPCETILCAKDLIQCDEMQGKHLPNMSFFTQDNTTSIQDIKENSVGVINKAFVIDENFDTGTCSETKAASQGILTTEKTISRISCTTAKEESQEKPVCRKRSLSTCKQQGYKVIITNLSFIRLLSMTSLGTFSAYSIVFIMPSLALEWGASDLTASLTVTVSGATELMLR